MQVPTTPHDVLNLWSPICDPRFGKVRGVGDGLIGPRGPVSCRLTHMVSLLPLFYSYLAGSKGVSARPTNPDMMTNATV